MFLLKHNIKVFAGIWEEHCLCYKIKIKKLCKALCGSRGNIWNQKGNIYGSSVSILIICLQAVTIQSNTVPDSQWFTGTCFSKLCDYISHNAT